MIVGKRILEHPRKFYLEQIDDGARIKTFKKLKEKARLE